MKRCPHCGSTRVTNHKNHFYCKRCGYLNINLKELKRKMKMDGKISFEEK